ncbi:MAG: pilus assembly protein PilM, partial [bacterium]|nr:pilus assembly protein PilM [bacterium]
MGTKVKKAIKYNTGITFRNSKIVITKSQYSKIGAYFPKDYELKSEYIYSYINTYDYIENLNQALSNTTHGFFENSNITFSLPFDQITVQKLSLPELNKRDLLSAINNQIDDLDEYFWTYRVLKSETQSQKGPNNILVIKIEKDIIEKYIKLFDKHKISLNSIVSEVDILEQFVSDLISNKIPKTMLAIDLENNFLKLSIFENNRMVFFRDVRLGFAEIIKPVLRKISYEGKEFEFDEEKAKEVLIENDIFDRKEKKDIPLDNIFFLLRPSLEKLVIEIQKTLQFYFKKSDSEINIASVLILGKLLQIKNVSSYFKESLNLPIEKPEFKANIVKIKHQNNISLQEAITMSAAASLETDNFSKTNLLPSYYITRKTHTSIVTILITFFLFWLLFILFLNVNYTKNIYTIK